MGNIANYDPIRQPTDTIQTLSPEEAAAFWSTEAVAERERNAPQPRE